jgi:uncharacterized protein (DUF952 family)
MTPIFHITTRAAWQQAQSAGAYRAESLEQAGFIHLSKPEQVVRVANAYYAEQRDLVLLVVDPVRLDNELRYEPPDEALESDERFPHQYGVLNLDAVIRAVDFPPEADGKWSRLPPGAEG